MARLEPSCARTVCHGCLHAERSDGNRWHPKEIKADERRAALTPDAARELISRGLEVRVETGAGAGAGISDEAFAAAGVAIVNPDEAWAAHLVVKVKEPQPEEFDFPRRHGAADLSASGGLPAGGGGPAQGRHHSHRLRNRPARQRQPPLLAPPSEIAGRLPPRWAPIYWSNPTAAGAC